jgi:hypothetical protein
MAMVHGLLGHDAQRARWVEVTHALTLNPPRLATCEGGSAATFDALLALHRGDADAALKRLSADIDDPDIWRRWVAARWRPWYAALWAEAAVLGQHPDAASRLQRAAAAARDNGIAAAIVQRAADLWRGERTAIGAHAQVFARLGCDYQRRRTQSLALDAA